MQFCTCYLFDRPVLPRIFSVHMGRQVGREAGRQTDIQRDGQQYSQRELKEVLDAAKDVITGQFSRAYTRSRFFLTL